MPRASFVVALAVLAAAFIEPAARAVGEVEMSAISGDPDAPRRHFRLRDPADVSDDRAESVYRIAVRAMAAGYASSGLDVGQHYRGWKRYNRAPYLSATHGNHYLSNYANPTAAAYGRFEEAGVLPVGSVLAKDSFSVTENGGILLGSLFVMEKMPQGFNYVSGDWKYRVIQPDGTIFGETNGAGSERVNYCIGCHLAVEHHDHLYFVPDAYRVTATE